MLTTVARRLLANLALAVASFAFALLVLELGARSVVKRREARGMTTRGSIVRYHPTFGWDKPPGASGWLRREEYEVHLAINSLGLRGPERGYDKPPGVVRTLLLGDSFTEGYTVAEDQTVRAALERELNGRGCGRHEVLNGGTIGYSTDQEYLFYLHEGRRYAPDVVAVMFCWNDIYFNTTGEQGKPYFELQEGKLELRNSPVPPPRDGAWVRSPEARQLVIQPWRGSMALRLLSDRTASGNPALHRLLARFALVEPARSKRPVPKDLWPVEVGHADEVEQWWVRTEAILRALATEVEKDGGQLVLVYIPERAELNDRNWQLSLDTYQGARKTWRRDQIVDRFLELGGALRLPILDPRQALRRAEAGSRPAYFPKDGHWTEVGHGVAAQELARFLVEQGLVRCSHPES